MLRVFSSLGGGVGVRFLGFRDGIRSFGDVHFLGFKVSLDEDGTANILSSCCFDIFP